MANSIKQFRLELQNEVKMSSKRVKIAVILILGFLLLNFVLVFVVMNRTSELSPPVSTPNFSAMVNQTHDTGKIVDEMKFDLDGIEKWINSTEEKFESHQLQIGSLSNQTKIDELEALEKDNRQLKKFHEELKEQFASLSQKFGQLLVDPQLLQSCRDALKILKSPRSEKQRIYPHGNNESLEVVCDFDVDGGGWTVIQKRTSGPKAEFYQDWANYTQGFGSLDNFWLGLENIHALTKNGDQELRIDLEDFNGNEAWAKYSSFSISDASDFYRLSLGGYYGNSTAGDSMTGEFNLNGAQFTTKDNENDGGSHNCAQLRQGAWWYTNVEWACSHSNLNGYYRAPEESFRPGQGLVWESWRGATTSLKKVQMKIRKRN